MIVMSQSAKSLVRRARNCHGPRFFPCLVHAPASDERVDVVDSALVLRDCLRNVDDVASLEVVPDTVTRYPAVLKKEEAL